MESNVVNQILSGDLDSKLDEIASALRARHKALREILSTEQFLRLKPGTKVSLVKVSPRYLAGQKARVVGYASPSGKVLIEWSDLARVSAISRGRFGTLPTTRIHVSCLEVVA